MANADASEESQPGWARIVDAIKAAVPLEPLEVAFPQYADRLHGPSRRSARKSGQKPLRPQSNGGGARAQATKNLADEAPAAPASTPKGNGAGRPPDAGARAAGFGEDGDGLNLRLAFYPQTDLGNAERFRERNRSKLLWCPGNGWYAWNGRFWCRDGAGEKVTAAEHDTVRAIQDEAEALRKSGRDVQVGTRFKGKADEEPVMMSDSLAAWGRASEQASRLAPIAKRTAPYLAVKHQGSMLIRSR